MQMAPAQRHSSSTDGGYLGKVRTLWFIYIALARAGGIETEGGGQAGGEGRRGHLPTPSPALQGPDLAGSRPRFISNMGDGRCVITQRLAATLAEESSGGGGRRRGALLPPPRGKRGAWC